MRGDEIERQALSTNKSLSSILLYCTTRKYGKFKSILPAKLIVQVQTLISRRKVPAVWCR